MLGINPVAGAGEGYYLDAVAKGVDEYYRGVGEAPGWWAGTVAGVRVRARAARSVPRTCGPCGAAVTRSPASRSAGSPNRQIGGFDLCWRAPKSVSLLFAFGDPGGVAAWSATPTIRPSPRRSEVPRSDRGGYPNRARRAADGTDRRVRGRHVPAPHQPHRRPSPPHPRAGRQPGPRRRRALADPRWAAALPPRQDRRLPLPGPPPPRAHPPSRRRLAARREGHRRPGRGRPQRDLGVLRTPTTDRRAPRPGRVPHRPSRPDRHPGHPPRQDQPDRNHHPRPVGHQSRRSRIRPRHPRGPGRDPTRLEQSTTSRSGASCTTSPAPKG